jgi:hypothetical protein
LALVGVAGGVCADQEQPLVRIEIAKERMPSKVMAEIAIR